MTRDQAHREYRTVGEEWDALRATQPTWLLAVKAICGAVVLIVLLGAFIAAALTGWGGMQ